MLNIQKDYTSYTVIYGPFNLFNKKKYIAHINTLKQALNHGLKLENS